MTRTRRLYHGYQAKAFFPEDVNELIEIRARERTFDGAYGRTAVGCLGFALTVLRLFDKRFSRIGIAYVVLSVMLYALAYTRQRHSKHDFADRDIIKPALPTKGQEHQRIFGRPFKTAGWIIVGVSAAVAAIEVVLFILVLVL
ncbi:unnamed protein product [Somion occarium]|uniref:DUF202 domain-containing protein n=1 Tax=Somion occarium TaxID=3059160 RepID=A0ABP1CUZ5_9APHY